MVGASEGAVWNMKYISQTTNIVHDIPQTFSLGMLKDLIDWVTFFLEQYSRIDTLNHLWVMMPPYTSFARLSKSYSQGMHWSHEEMEAPGCMIFQFWQ